MAVGSVGWVGCGAVCAWAAVPGIDRLGLPANRRALIPCVGGRGGHYRSHSTLRLRSIRDVLDTQPHTPPNTNTHSPSADDDAELLYIAEWAIMAPVPEGWTEHADADGNEFYYNVATGVSTYEHPLDEQFRSYFRQIKAQKMGQSLSDSLKQMAGPVAA